jgi:phage shock protein A
MTEKEKRLFVEFETKLQRLCSMHRDLQQQCKTLQQQLAQAQEDKQNLQAALDNLKARYANLKMATTINFSGEDVRATKARLSKLISEVDACMALLSEA